MLAGKKNGCAFKIVRVNNAACCSAKFRRERETGRGGAAPGCRCCYRDNNRFIYPPDARRVPVCYEESVARPYGVVFALIAFIYKLHYARRESLKAGTAADSDVESATASRHSWCKLSQYHCRRDDRNRSVDCSRITRATTALIFRRDKTCAKGKNDDSIVFPYRPFENF